MGEELQVRRKHGSVCDSRLVGGRTETFPATVAPVGWRAGCYGREPHNDLEQLLKNLKLRRILEIYDEQVEGRRQGGRLQFRVRHWFGPHPVAARQEGALEYVIEQNVSADIKRLQNWWFCRWDRRWAGARDTRMRRRETWASVGASGNCAMTDSRAG